MNWTFEIPLLAPGLNGSNGLIRMHWAKYRETKATWVQWMAVSKHKPFVRASDGEIRAHGTPSPRWPLEEGVTVKITRHWCRGSEMDIDNLYATAKIPLDAMRTAGIIAEDDPAVVTSLVMAQVKAPSVKEVRTIVELSW